MPRRRWERLRGDQTREAILTIYEDHIVEMLDCLQKEKTIALILKASIPSPTGSLR
jgi:hypothetical protein